MTLIIRFSNDYYKLPDDWQDKKAILIAASYCPDMQALEKELPAFIEFDTVIRTDDPMSAERYPINFKEGIILVFVTKQEGKMFTTIRRYTPEKMKYYEGSVWKTFIMVYEKNS